MCLVEEKKSSKLLASCVLLLLTGMVVYTKTKVIKKCRESVLEYLLMNHPLDCPICDQGGECDLQDQTMVFGGDRSRFYELKKKSTENKNFNSGVKMFLNRCIYCGRCVRFLNKLVKKKNNPLKLLGRGYNTEISFYEKFFKLDNYMVANIIDLCPVGALVSKPFSFFSRPWEVTYLNSISIIDSYHSNVKVYFQGTFILKVVPRTNNFLNGEWICDKTRFFFDSLVLQRLVTPLFLSSSFSFVSIIWIQFFVFFKFLIINSVLNFLFLSYKNLRILTKLGFFLDFESLLNIKHFFNKLGSNFITRYKKNLSLNYDLRNFYLFKDKSTNIFKSVSNFIIINSNLRIEVPVLNFKVVRSLNNLSNIFVLGFLSNFNYKLYYFGNSFLAIMKFLEFNFITLKTSLKKILLVCGYNFFSIFKNIFLLNPKIKDLMSIYYIYLFSSDVNINELSLPKNKIKPAKNISFIYNFGLDDFELAENNNLSRSVIVFYQGQHGEYYSVYSDIILPTQSFIEKSSIFINLEGWLQFTGYSNFKYIFDKIKNDSKVMGGLSEYFFKVSDKLQLIKNYIVIFKKQLVTILNLNFSNELNNFRRVFASNVITNLNINFSSQITNLTYLNLFRISNNIFFNDKMKLFDFNFLKNLLDRKLVN